MSDEFLTKGLQRDRYLKAKQLRDQFQAEIESVLGQFGQRMVEQHPHLFDQPVDPSIQTRDQSSSALEYHRINYSMSDTESQLSDQILNVHLYWLPPTEYGRTDIDGALRAFGYKIKNADQEADARVIKQTQNEDWDLETSGNPFDSNEVFYRHVSSAAEIKKTRDVLVDHFSAFGDEYAANPHEQ